ncbi:MAG: ribokinase [Candidatus Methylacidiphilales bacterium]|nr:ribokinase [Candidatus Methylacidiphilales bacterium]
MSTILNFGSINIDYVYAVRHFVRPGETLASQSLTKGPGGKGFNQSIALARAGAHVSHLGKIGQDGIWLRDLLKKEGADVQYLTETDLPSGHAIIQVDQAGQNSILLHGGANLAFLASDYSRLLQSTTTGDIVLAQNETSCVPEMLELAKKHGATVAFNPAPMSPEVKDFPLQSVDYLFVNEGEAMELSGRENLAEAADEIRRRWPNVRLVLTLGAEGVRYMDSKLSLQIPGVKVEAVDTTAAGDTFIGYFLTGVMSGLPTKACLERACRAAAISVTRRGAADSVPYLAELES